MLIELGGKIVELNLMTPFLSHAFLGCYSGYLAIISELLSEEQYRESTTPMHTSGSYPCMRMISCDSRTDAIDSMCQNCARIFNILLMLVVEKQKHPLIFSPQLVFYKIKVSTGLQSFQKHTEEHLLPRLLGLLVKSSFMLQD